ncbi:MAG: precorrin-6y C5,15-methyltransferase (decarboxylating) subunit CbiE [Pseudomonadota bacterium]
MTAPWLDIIGVGADGLPSLSPVAISALEQADAIYAGERLHALTEGVPGERVSWPTPFDAMISSLKARRGKKTVVLATGDPLWYSIGARLGREIDPAEIIYHPQLSGFQFAAARMGWSLADVETLTVHGRAPEQMIPFIQPGAKLLILPWDGSTPSVLGGFLAERGYGDSRITALANLGSADEQRFEGTANAPPSYVPGFHVLAVECMAGDDTLVLGRGGGLPDHVFQGDGTMTKQEVRAITLAKLMPMRGQHLWDIGSGCGSVAVEWMRAARDATATGVEPRDDRCAYARANATALGTPKLKLVQGTAPDALNGLVQPDAVFIGGGLSGTVFETAWAALPKHGRLVANGVTLETEAVLRDLHARHGGQLVRIAVERAEPVGDRTGWRPAMTVTQWSLMK